MRGAAPLCGLPRRFLRQCLRRCVSRRLFNQCFLMLPVRNYFEDDMFYGWKIGLLSMGGNFMLQGTVLYCMNAFM